MSSTAKLATALAALVLAATAVAGCTVATAPQTADPTPKPTVSATPTPTYLTELPEWARENSRWLIYPDGFECYGTEGCANDYRAFFGEPGPVLPEGVEYYEPARHDCVVVQPASVDCTAG
ncbi:hypothetical protein [Microbacterium yannicii]|uniref:hypothetical protein n=1 Tax=Microbacterium yannicii TaxID=671622 RepID=UPI0012FC1F63|nr:hypothetical protein [Microbacterium yannicii]